MKLCFAFCAMCFLAGCGANSTTSKTAGNDGDISISNGDGTATATEIHLKDGTPCAVLVGAYKGAISCGWATH